MPKETKLIGPECGYIGDKTRMRFVDYDHTPRNKRHGEVKSQLNITFDRHPRAEWVSILVDEVTTHRESGRSSSRCISLTLSPEHAKRLAQFIAEGN